MKKLTVLGTALCLAFAITSAKAQTTPETNNPTSTGIRTGPTNTDPRSAINAPSQIQKEIAPNPDNRPSGTPGTQTNTSSAGAGRMTGSRSTGGLIQTYQKTRDTIVTVKP